MHEDEIIDIYDFYNPSVDVFLNIEYKKRHFEYYDKQDSKWLNNHWNDITKYCFSDEQSQRIFLLYLINLSGMRNVNIKFEKVAMANLVK